MSVRTARQVAVEGRRASGGSYCRIASWDKPWQISRAMEVATPSSSKMLRVCSTISTDGWSCRSGREAPARREREHELGFGG